MAVAREYDDAGSWLGDSRSRLFASDEDWDVIKNRMLRASRTVLATIMALQSFCDSRSLVLLKRLNFRSGHRGTDSHTEAMWQQLIDDTVRSIESGTCEQGERPAAQAAPGVGPVDASLVARIPAPSPAIPTPSGSTKPEQDFFSDPSKTEPDPLESGLQHFPLSREYLEDKVHRIVCAWGKGGELKKPAFAVIKIVEGYPAARKQFEHHMTMVKWPGEPGSSMPELEYSAVGVHFRDLTRASSEFAGSQITLEQYIEQLGPLQAWGNLASTDRVMFDELTRIAAESEGVVRKLSPDDAGKVMYLVGTYLSVFLYRPPQCKKRGLLGNSKEGWGQGDWGDWGGSARKPLDDSDWGPVWGPVWGPCFGPWKTEVPVLANDGEGMHDVFAPVPMEGKWAPLVHPSSLGNGRGVGKDGTAVGRHLASLVRRTVSRVFQVLIPARHLATSDPVLARTLPRANCLAFAARSDAFSTPHTAWPAPRKFRSLKWRAWPAEAAAH